MAFSSCSTVAALLQHSCSPVAAQIGPESPCCMSSPLRLGSPFLLTFLLLLCSLKVTAVAQVASLRSSAFRVCSAFMVWAWVRSPRLRRKMPPAHCVPFFICFGFFSSALGTSSKICSCATSDSWTTPLATDLFFCRCPLRGSPHCTCFMLCHRWLCGPAAALFLLSRARGVVYSRGCTTSRTVEVLFAVALFSLCFCAAGRHSFL